MDSSINNSKNNETIAEVIESSLSSFQAQAWNLDSAPEFGSLVTIKYNDNKPRAFGIVYDIVTSSIDDSRTTIAYKKTKKELKRDMPHIFELMRTTFTCITVGYHHNDKIHYQLSPQPPGIHDNIIKVNQGELKSFFDNDYFLHLLFSYPVQNISHDELLLAIFNYLNKNHILTRRKLGNLIKAYSQILDNYKHLKIFLKRAQQLLDI